MSENAAKNTGEEALEASQAMHGVESQKTEKAELGSDVVANIDANKNPESPAKGRAALARVREFFGKGLSVLRDLCQNVIAKVAPNGIGQNEYSKYFEIIDRRHDAGSAGHECANKANDATKRLEDTERTANGDATNGSANATATAPPQGDGGGRAPRA